MIVGSRASDPQKFAMVLAHIHPVLDQDCPVTIAMLWLGTGLS